MSFKNYDRKLTNGLDLTEQLFLCPYTKDATFLCADNTAIPIHKNVAAQRSTVLQDTFYAREKVPGSPEIHCRNSTVRLKANKDAAFLVVEYLYFGVPMNSQKWQQRTMAAQPGNESEKIQNWVHCIRQIATVAKRLNLRPLLNFLICNIYKTIFYEKGLVSDLLFELVSPIIEPEDTVEEFVTLASYSYWFLKSKTTHDVCFSYGTNVQSSVSYQDVLLLDESLFEKRSDIDHRTTPTVLLLGSNDKDVNGVYKMMELSIDQNWNMQWEKSIHDRVKYIFSEPRSTEENRPSKNSHHFQLKLEKLSKRKTMSNATTTTSSLSVLGNWSAECACPEWDAFEGNVSPPVPLRFCLNW